MAVIVLISRYEFNERRDLWATTSEKKNIAAPNFGRIMPHYRSNALLSAIRYSDNMNQPNDTFPNKWGLVNDFVTVFNAHRELCVTPSELISVDESMSHWYVLGVDWVDVGLPIYRVINRKPEKGCEIKNSACRRSRIM